MRPFIPIRIRVECISSFNDVFQNQSQVLVFDMYSYALLGTMNLPQVNGDFLDLVKLNNNKLAFNTTGAELYFVNISAIPLNTSVSPPPPVDSLPPTGRCRYAEPGGQRPGIRFIARPHLCERTGQRRSTRQQYRRD